MHELTILFNFFIPFTGTLWNKILLSVFPPLYDLNTIERKVSKNLSYEINYALGISFEIITTFEGDTTSFIFPLSFYVPLKIFYCR